MIGVAWSERHRLDPDHGRQFLSQNPRDWLELAADDKGLVDSVFPRDRSAVMTRHRIDKEATVQRLPAGRKAIEHLLQRTMSQIPGRKFAVAVIGDE